MKANQGGFHTQTEVVPLSKPAITGTPTVIAPQKWKNHFAQILKFQDYLYPSLPYTALHLLSKINEMQFFPPHFFKKAFQVKNFVLYFESLKC